MMEGMMEGMMVEKDRIREELTEQLEAYNNGSFPQMACDMSTPRG